MALVSLFTLLALLLAACQPVMPPVAAAPQAPSAEALMVNRSDVHLFTAEELTIIPGAWSTLERREEGIRLEIDTVGLAPGEAYTIWWVIFNNPAACGDDGCTGPDLEIAEVQASVLYATGEIADEEGRAHFTAELAVGDTTEALDNNSGFPFHLVEPVPGLQDPLGAEVHTVIRTHGAALEDPTEQLTSFGLGCNPECKNMQASMHLPPRAPEVLALNRSDIHLFAAEELTLVPGAWSTLERREGGIHLEIDTVDLVPGEAYTIWWVVFNNPAACAGGVGACNAPDLASTEVQASVLYATGEIADEEGHAHFTAELAVGDTTEALDNSSGFPFELLEPAPGLQNSLGAEIHAVIRTHGAALEDPTEQLTSFGLGCNPQCMNKQASMHMPIQFQ